MRLLLPVLALALLASACGSDDPEPTAAPSPTASVATPPPSAPDDPLSPRPALESPAPTGGPTCSAGSLTVTDADLLADETALQEVFAVRTSGGACQLRGWPVVTLLGGDGHPIDLTAHRVGTATAATLSRSTSLSFVLGTPRTSSCQDAATLVVRLPGTDRSLRAKTTMQVCEHRLDVGPVERRQDQEGSEH